MIEEQYVSFETAKLLKEKGFDGECVNYYTDKGELCGQFPYYRNSELPNKDDYARPTLQLACKWLREVHHIHVCPEYKAFFQERPKKTYHHWCCKIAGIGRYFKKGINDVNVLDFDDFYFSSYKAYHDSYEEACEECIKFALEHLLD